MNNDGSVLNVYEAQGNDIEKQEEIDRLKREKDELTEKLRRFELAATGETK